MRRWLKLLRLARRAGRPSGFDALFAVAFVVFAGGLVTLIYGLLVSDENAVPGLGIVCMAAGAYASTVFGAQDPGSGRGALLRSLGRGFRQLWHLVSPPGRRR